jgi:hypothetical protein
VQVSDVVEPDDGQRVDHSRHRSGAADGFLFPVRRVREAQVLLQVFERSHVVSRSDRQRIDQYFTAIREIEESIAREDSWIGRPRPDAPLKQPERKVKGTTEISTFFNLMVAAIQTNSTRVIRYRQPLASLLNEITTKHSTHQISHHPNDASRYQVSQDKDTANAASQ